LSLYLTKFIERLRGAEARGGRDFVMPLAEAKGVGADLTELLLELKVLKEAKNAQKDEVIEVKLTGGKF
jgi:hypothetical protein